MPCVRESNRARCITALRTLSSTAHWGRVHVVPKRALQITL
jgi:hypothetical protein